MKAILWFLLSASLLLILPARSSTAQMFGDRDLGSALRRRSTPSLSNRSTSQSARPSSARSSRSSGRGNVNTVAGGEGPELGAIGTMVDEQARFIRGNREATDFVGTDSGEAEAFVGSQQAGVGEMVESAVDEALEIETSEAVNLPAEPVIPPRMLLNAPRLQLGFTPQPDPPGQLVATVHDCLQSSLPEPLASGIEVSAEAGVVTLQGVVPSERERKLAELLVSFEPGVQRVRNGLTTASTARPLGSPPPPPAAASPVPAAASPAAGDPQVPGS